MEIEVKLPKGEASTSFSGLSTEEEPQPSGADTQRGEKSGKPSREAGLNGKLLV